MDLFLQLHNSPVFPLITILLVFPLYYLLIWKSRSNKTSKEAPLAPGAWPIIGHLWQLAKGSELPHITLASMADSYGSVFMLRLGLRPTLVVSDWEGAKECFGTNEKAFATRPSSVAIKLMGYNYAMFGFTPYGSFWRKMRKIVAQELLSHRHFQRLQHVWASEIDTGIKELFQVWANHEKAGGSGQVLVGMQQWCRDLTLNVGVRLVAGKRFSKADDGEKRRCQKALRDFIRLIAAFVVSDYLPFLGWLDLDEHQKEMKKTAKELDYFLQGWLDEYRAEKLSGVTNGDEDFMSVMDSLLKDSDITDYDLDTVNKATMQSLILGGSDTLAVTIIWALTLLVNNPHVIKKAQDELDFHVGKERHVVESDIKNLEYLHAIVKETMRLSPPGPLSAPHEAMEDCTVSGYRIPAGTRLIVNIWKMQRDSRVWSNPLEFRPERFLMENAGVDIKGQHFQLLPFGSGRRSCPGMSLALPILYLTLARILQAFELATVSGSPVDMTGTAGLGNLKECPLEVLITPRLASVLAILSSAD